MKHTLRLRVAIAAVAGFTALGGASPAFAYGSDTTGSTATGNSTGAWTVKDTLCDSEGAYGNFIEKNHTGVQRKNNNSGCTTTVSGDIGNAITSVQACRDVTAAKDNCGGWNEW
ncbi:hypothetical protein ALI22I_14180 [Saccharothrix sp. ALI-22-I]|uniref:hypothetical protein n=1 Tax=Saccharothrix sp. ALI-22-I TaxID=1933778 RepID=UPI00097C38FB|nr:hypothetical protein [Saccharothrix sp. ALI-22-I]ONI90047.1 hypothetical protein ALI22I_14180 [Saccharothrix sp. ALI-22-I]